MVIVGKKEPPRASFDVVAGAVLGGILLPWADRVNQPMNLNERSSNA